MPQHEQALAVISLLVLLPSFLLDLQLCFPDYPVQFRFEINSKGAEIAETDRKIKRKFVPDFAGIIYAWKDPETGISYVVDGHHRYLWAVDSGMDLPNVQWINAKTAQEARAWGARLNIAQGNATPTDIAIYAKTHKLTPEMLKAEGIVGKVVDKGSALANLNEFLWRKYLDRSLPETMAVNIGKNLVKEEEQNALYNLSKNRKLDADTVDELVKLVKSSDSYSETQLNLFGEEEITKNTVVEKAQLLAAAKKFWGQNNRVLKAVTGASKQEILAGAGNVINVEKSKAMADVSAKAEFLLEKLASTPGRISTILNEGSQALAAGGQGVGETTRK
jgi:hypothetical protein